MPNTYSHFMVYAGVHFKTCPIKIREAWNKVADSHAVNECIYKVTSKNFEFVNIGTCNRFDICIFGKITKKQVFEIFYNLALDYFISHDFVSFIENPEKIWDYLQIDFDAEALRRLFKVTASLDSLVLGEQQIFGQIKAAYAKCTQLGYAKKAANQIFSHNFRVTKKVRNETEIAKNSVSIGHAVIDMNLEVFESFDNKKILIIGAGSMAKIIAKNFYSQRVKQIHLANRTLERAQKIASDLNSSTNQEFVLPLDLSAALKEIHMYDITIVAISGSDYLINQDVLQNFKKKRQGELTVFIDISVPRKITPAANEIDNVFLFYVDDLNAIMEQNRTLRKKSASEAEGIIENEVQAYITLCEKNENLMYVAKMHQWLTSAINYEVDSYLYDSARNKKISSTVIANAVAKKLISRPALLSRANEKGDNSINSVGEMLEFLFNLSSQNITVFKKKIRHAKQNNNDEINLDFSKSSHIDSENLNLTPIIQLNQRKRR